MIVKILIVLAIFAITTFFDALRDGFLGKVGFWKWHFIKWVSFYTPIIYIGIVNLPFNWKINIGVLLMVSPLFWLLWRYGLKLTGTNWPTWLLKWRNKIDG